MILFWTCSIVCLLYLLNVHCQTDMIPACSDFFLSLLCIKFHVPHYTLSYPLWTKFRGVYRNHSVRPSVGPSVCRVLPITLFCFDIGLPYLAHECITMGQCVTYIHDIYIYMTLTFGLNIKIYMLWIFMTYVCPWPATYTCSIDTSS